MFPIFAAPWAFAALAALPALAAIYWLRNSYQTLPVSSLMLWLDVVESRASGLKVKRLRTPLLFFIEMAILLMLAIAATGPRMEVGSLRPPIVVVLDDSVSMLTGGEDSPRTRAMAALQADTIWGGTIRFVLAGATPQALGGPVETWAEARDQLREWKCQSPTAQIAPAIALAGELGGDKVRVIVISDRGPGRDLEAGRVVWKGYGEPRDNLAILRASRATRESQDRLAVGIGNFSDIGRTAILVVETVDPVRELQRESIELGPRETKQVAYQLKGDAGPVRVRLATTDALAADDVAYLVPDETPPLRVELKIADDGVRELFRKALDATGKVLPPGAQPHLLITDAAEMPIVSPGTWVVQLVQEKEADAFLGPFVLDRTHPLTEGLSLAGIVWGGGKTDLAGAPVILAGNVPLLTDVEQGTGQHRVRLRLRADLSTLPQSPNWPILMWNLLTWRGRALPGLERVNITLGEPSVYTTRAAGELATVTLPGGESRTLPVRGHRLVAPTPVAGIYDLRHGEGAVRFAVSALAADESDLTDAATGTWGEWTEDGGGVPGLISLTWLFLILALGLFVVHLAIASRG